MLLPVETVTVPELVKLAPVVVRLALPDGVNLPVFVVKPNRALPAL